MNRLWLRLSISFLLVTWLIIGITGVVIRLSIQSSFRHYVNQSNVERFGVDFVSSLEAYYATYQSWDGVDTLLPGGRGRQNGGEQRGAQVFIAAEDGSIVAATNTDWVGLPMDSVGARRSVPLVVDSKQVGTLGEQTPGALALNEADTRFLQDTTNGLLVTAVVGGLAALLLGIAVSWTLTRPLHQLTDQVGQLTMSDLGQPISARGTDEMRHLAEVFNTLSNRLAETERARQRMAADAAHELRTPVTITRGHLEAMMDGIYPLDMEHLAVAYDQILHLARLVEDLRLLTLAEAGQLPLNKSAVQIGELVTQAAARFAPLADDAHIRLVVEVDENIPSIHVDSDRIQQVLDNLLTNALRHTPEDGAITIIAHGRSPSIEVTIANTGDSISTEQAKHLFDRFWRADEARERDSGGSGLGLAITRQLLRLHSGDIDVVAEKTGTAFRFHLPISEPAQ